MTSNDFTDTEDKRAQLAQASAVLLFRCRDQLGIISGLSNFFERRDISIINYENFVEGDHFFARIEWRLNNEWETEAAFKDQFGKLVAKFSASFDVKFLNRRQSVGLFVSKQFKVLDEVLKRQEAPQFNDVDVTFIVGNDESARSLADRYATPFFLIEDDQDPLSYEQQQFEVVNRYSPDCIGLAQYSKVLSTNFLQKLNCPVINVQPTFLPAFVGEQPYKMAYDRGVKLLSAISHLVTPELGQGPIVEQNVKRLELGASLEELIELNSQLECQVFIDSLLKVLQMKVFVHKNRTIVFR